MDWVFTPSSSSWDLTELEMDEFDLLDKSQTMEDFYGFDDKLSEEKHSIMPSSPSGSSKKPRVESTEQHVSCLVDGCRADLSGCRDYHRRHRVCETHSKTPVVTIFGKQQRFCQQCSRFHSLKEFDEVKRSCRKRLDGHNRRRRKLRPESMYLNYGSFFTNQQGTKLLHFGGRPDQERLNQKLQITFEQRTPSSNSYARFCSVRERRFPFLLDVDSDKVNQPVSESSSVQQVVNTNASLARLVVEPQGVLYLLSNSKHTIHNSSVSGPTNSLVQLNGSLSQHSGPHHQSPHVTGPDSGHTDNQMIGMIHFRADELLENEAAQVLSFSWG